MLILRRLREYVLLYPFLGLLGAYSIQIPAGCNSPIFCTGELLEKVQLAGIFHDSKTFVDLKLKYSQSEVLANFAKLMNESMRNPTREQLNIFVKTNFEDGNELTNWSPPDFNPSPPILDTIKDPILKQFAKDIIGIWPKLGRRVDPAVVQQPERYSFVPVPNGFIVPGGRFKELYYWDSYWIVRGLLISNMVETAKGMIENLLYLVENIGYIPNGSRVYYLGRSQPPLLTAMVAEYIEKTGDLAWLQKHLPTVEKELHYWLNRQNVTVKFNGKSYVLLRYIADKSLTGPRPESYNEDYKVASELPQRQREKFYFEMKSAAESGWDFSSRWFATANNSSIGNRTNVHASRILPVDLNAIFAGALELAGNFRNILKNKREARKWWSLAKYWRASIKAVLWHRTDGVWYDYDSHAKAPRRHFYPSCVTPLWSGAVEELDAPFYASRIVRYLLTIDALKYPGGIPTSLEKSGEQWDFPNAFPPLQSIVIAGLEASGYEEARVLAREQANIWIKANYLGYSKWQKMFEKYSAVEPGTGGGGGEYILQDGFGWTNGIILELLQEYGSTLSMSNPIVSQFK